MRRITLSLFVAIGSFSLSIGCAQARSRVTNEEFSFSAMFPAGLEVCQSYSGTHLQGYYASLSSDVRCGSDLYERSKTLRFASIVASFNSDFSPGLVGVTPGKCVAMSLAEQGRLQLLSPRIDGQTAVACLVRERNGAIVIKIATRYGSSGFSNEPEASAKRVNLTVNLGTDKSHLQQDLRAFRQLVASIRTHD